MDFIKKNLGMLLCCCSAVLAALVFAFMAGTGASVTLFGYTGASSLYKIMGMDDGRGAGPIVGMVFEIIVLLGAACLAVLPLLKKSLGYEHFISLGLSVFALVAGIMYFCTTSIIGGGDIGWAAVICGIIGILQFLALACNGALKFLKK